MKITRKYGTRSPLSIEFAPIFLCENGEVKIVGESPDFSGNKTVQKFQLTIPESPWDAFLAQREMQDLQILFRKMAVNPARIQLKNLQDESNAETVIISGEGGKDTTGEGYLYKIFLPLAEIPNRQPPEAPLLTEHQDLHQDLDKLTAMMSRLVSPKPAPEKVAEAYFAIINNKPFTYTDNGQLVSKTGIEIAEEFKAAIHHSKSAIIKLMPAQRKPKYFAAQCLMLLLTHLTDPGNFSMVYGRSALQFTNISKCFPDNLNSAYAL
ncbi:MAG TPA: hypothetical protein DCS21_07855 [Gammaproteobacteria bacterium]|nr:hypothetical protein [Gammaproteobacteria bacterium]